MNNGNIGNTRSVTVSFRFPINLVDEIDRRRDAQGTSRCAVVKECIAYSLGLELPKTEETLAERMVKMEDKVAGLESQIRVLRELVKDGPNGSEQT